MFKLLFSQDAAEWSSALLVILSGGLTGHYASAGMNILQWAGAVTAILGSVTVAVAVRAWPTPERARIRDED